MPKIVWSEDFSVGHLEIDGQHRKWIDIFNTAYDRMMNQSIEKLSTLGIDALEEMHQYATMHFEFEEAYMKRIGYPDLASHIAIHNAFKGKLERIRNDYQNNIRPLNSEIMKLIENWLVNHILSEDQKYKAHALST